ncbi:MAG: pectate lyase [Rubripirellula sp.]
MMMPSPQPKRCRTPLAVAMLALASLLLTADAACCQESDELTREQVVGAMHRAVNFFRDSASADGGYVYQLSADLSKREGEGVVGPTTAWIQPPGTPAVGMGYLMAYQLCGDPLLLEAAKETAEALQRGQLESGGWDNRIEFDPDERQRYAYRSDRSDLPKRKLRNTTTLDDDKSQSVIRFLMQLDQELEMKDADLRDTISYALDSLLRAQYPNGAWPQKFSEHHDPTDFPVLKASLPKSWPKTFPGKKYAGFYTLNDNTMGDVIETLLDAWDIYGEQRFLDAAVRGGEFFLLAQLPEPQPGWAQQYDRSMHPAWARKFEPPAVSGGESQRVMQTLMLLYRRTSTPTNPTQRFLEPLPRAIDYYRKSELADGQMARFYELHSNRPLYFTRDYQLTYASDDMPTHYAFIVKSNLDRIERELHELQSDPADALQPSSSRLSVKRTSKLDALTAKVIESLDERGAWVEEGQLRYHGEQDSTREVIRSTTFVRNLLQLARWMDADASSAESE